MADAVTVDASTGETITRPLSDAEIAQRSLDIDTGRQVAAADRAAAVRTSDAVDALTQLIAQAGGPANVRAKLKAVVAGTDTLTNQQAQRLLAAVALVLLRDRDDT